MLKAYIDGSGDGAPVLVLAGYIGTAEQWAAFTDDWDDKLKQAGLSRFKMCEMLNQPEIAGWFYRTIEEHVSAGVACAVPRGALIEVAQRLGIEGIDRRFSNPYYFAVRAIINMTAQHQTKMGFHEPIDFIFDNQNPGEERAIRDAWHYYLDGPITDDVRKLTGALPQFGKDEALPPLQAADLLAWWMRDRHQKDGTLLIEELPFPWPIKRDIPRLMMEFNEAGLEAEMRTVRRAMVEQTDLRFVDVRVTFTGLDGRKF